MIRYTIVIGCLFLILLYNRHIDKKESVRRIDSLVEHFENTYNMDSLYKVRDSINNSI